MPPPPHIVLLLYQRRASRPHLLLPSIQTCSRTSLDLSTDLRKDSPSWWSVCSETLPLFGDTKVLYLPWDVRKAFSRHRILSRILKSLRGRLSPTQMTVSPCREGGAAWYRQVSWSWKLTGQVGHRRNYWLQNVLLVYTSLPAVENKNGIFFFSRMKVFSTDNLNVILVILNGNWEGS